MKTFKEILEKGTFKDDGISFNHHYFKFYDIFKDKMYFKNGKCRDQHLYRYDPDECTKAKSYLAEQSLNDHPVFFF